ncbi:zinc-ribbon domain-containing protein [Alphaproteobacteria bacterium]|nr:zinc-ribbon domain-containing protein [Alphaproteobacteria bacterium]
MFKTCKSCGTTFDLDENILSNNVLWLKCSVCNEKWSLSEKPSEDTKKINVNKDKKLKLDKNNSINETKNVINELASIKSVVEDQTKRMSQKNNPILDIKNKSVAEISSELSASKLKSEDIKPVENVDKIKNQIKKDKKKLNLFPFVFIFLIMFFSSLLFFRSALFSYSYFYFPKHTEKYLAKINDVLSSVQLPIFVELGHIKMIDFVATIQQDTVKFSGVIKNNSLRPILTPRIRILAIREDRKILMEKIIVTNEKIIMPSSAIEFKDFYRINSKEENISVKAVILKNLF